MRDHTRRRTSRVTTVKLVTSRADDGIPRVRKSSRINMAAVDENTALEISAAHEPLKTLEYMERSALGEAEEQRSY